MFTFFAFTKPYLVICEPVVVRRILTDPIFIKGEDYTSVFSLAFGSGLVTSNGDVHRKDKKMFSTFFMRGSISKYMDVINTITKEAMNSSLGEAVLSKPINIEDFLGLLALRIFMRFACSHKLSSEQEREVSKIVSKGSHEMGQLVGLGLPLWDFIPPVKYVKWATGVLGGIFMKIVEDRKEEIRAAGGTVRSEVDDCISAMITHKISDDEIKAHMMTLICAGHDTTAFFSAYTCFLLATNPVVQDALRQDILAVAGPNGNITADHVTEMKYLQKVQMEALRLYSIIPAVTRFATEEVVIKDETINVTIPKGSTVMVPMFLINRDPSLWTDPSAFNPERFEGSEQGNGAFTSAKRGFFPFGFGNRICIGNILAQMESSVFLCHLLRRFILKPEPGFKPAILSGISLTTSNGINIILEERVEKPKFEMAQSESIILK